MKHQVDLHVEGEFPGDHCLYQLVEKHHVNHPADLHVEGKFPGDHCLRPLVERHHADLQAGHSSWEENLPSVVGVEDSLPFVTSHDECVLLPEKIGYKCVQTSISVGGKYNPLTVSVHVVRVRLPATIVDQCVLLSVLAGNSIVCL